MFAKFSGIIYQAKRFAQVTKSIPRRAYSGNARDKQVPVPFGVELYVRGVKFFGMGSFVFAIALTAGNAYDARNNSNFSATLHVQQLCFRTVKFPILYGLSWPIWVPIMLLGDACLNMWKLYNWYNTST